MRLTISSKALVIGCAIAAGSTGCKDDPANGPTDTGVDLGTTDTGTDAGQDVGTDLGTDVGTPDPVLLRFAHMGYGTTYGPVHICADDGAGNNTLVTTDALITGNFANSTMVLPLSPFAITKHFQVPADALELLAGRTVKVYRASEAGAAISSGFGYCAPGSSVTPLATMVVGTGTGELNLTPGSTSTIALIGADGPELATACAGNPCPAPAIIHIQDEMTNPSTTQARLRVLLGDARYGAAPGACHDVYMNPVPAPLPITAAAGLAAYGGGTATYSDALPIEPPPNGMGGVIPHLLTLHAAGSALTPCDVNIALPGNGVVPVGTMPNPELSAQFAAGAPLAAALLDSLPAGSISTIFIVPAFLDFKDVANSNAGCNAGSSATCLPAGPCPVPDVTYCSWTSLAAVVDDSM